jgi:uncharacterized protein (TIGR04141 family)
MTEEKNVAHLSIFLIKNEFKQDCQIIKENDCNDPIEIPISGCEKAQLYIKRTSGIRPKWASIFRDIIDLDLIGKTANISAAFLIKISDKHFVLTFGQAGRFLIRDDVCEERFGLLVALNSVDKESFRCIDKQSLDTIESHTRIQAGHDTTADQFGLDVEQDMLKAIVGTPREIFLGTRMTGTDALSVSVRMDLSFLPTLLTYYQEKYEQDLNTTDYQWVNNISLVKNSSSIIKELDIKLLEKFANKDYVNLWLAIPEIINWETVKGFIYQRGKKTIYPDINIEGFLSTIDKNESITLDLLKNRHVYCADEDHNYVFKSWSIHKCIYAEIDYEGNKYILNDTKWYKVNQDFVSRTNNDFKKITKSTLTLPKYYGGGEGKYNSDVAKNYPESFVLLDDKNKIFHGGGHGQIEVCDLFSKDKQLIHIKIYGKSSIFSHLISQGFVSGRLLQLDSEFRNKVKNKLQAPFNKLIEVDRRPNENEFTIIYGIISESEGDDLYLPFFSRVNLNNTTKTLKGFGYNVELLKIFVDDTCAKKKICAPKKRK